MIQNVKQYLFIIAISLLVGFGISYAWNNKTIEQQIEEQNTAILQDCLSKARMKQVPSEILEATSHCNKDLLKTIYSPSYSWTVKEDIITKEEQDCIKNTPDRWSEDPEMIQAIRKCNDKYWTASTTPVSSAPLWFQIIPSANAQMNESVKSVKTSTTSHIECDQKCKIKVLVDAWIGKNLAKEIVTVCKSMAKNPVHCIKYASSVSSAESGWWKSCYKNNCFWIKAWTIWFKTLNEWVIDWVTRYNKYWWKATSMSQFYAPKWKLPYFRYCTSEHSSNSSKWCPNGLKHSSSTFNKITF